MPQYFFITGLPRSRTAWLAALFNTHEDVICLHEPINQFGRWEAVKEYIENLPYKYVGVSDSSMSLYGDFFIKNFIYKKLLVIIRDEVEVEKSLSYFLNYSKEKSNEILRPLKYNLPLFISKFYHWIKIDFYDLNKINTIKEIWQYCVPSIPFDKNKCEIFQRLIINQHKEKIISEMGIENQSILNDN